MSKINNIAKYKKALKFTKDLAKLAEVLQTSEKELEKFKHYKPAQECIEVLSRSLTLVRVHLTHNKKIVESKGEE